MFKHCSFIVPSSKVINMKHFAWRLVVEPRGARFIQIALSQETNLWFPSFQSLSACERTLQHAIVTVASNRVCQSKIFSRSCSIYYWPQMRRQISFHFQNFLNSEWFHSLRGIQNAFSWHYSRRAIFDSFSGLPMSNLIFWSAIM